MNQSVGRPRSRRLRSVGQTLVEFALVIPIFLLVLCGLFDAGRLVYMNTVLSQAARESARLAAVEASWMGSTDASCNAVGGPVCPASFAALFSDSNAAANRMVTPFATIPANRMFMSCDAESGVPTGDWTTRSCAVKASGNYVSVRVTMTFSAVTPLIGQLLPPISLSGVATMAIN